MKISNLLFLALGAVLTLPLRATDVFEATVGPDRDPKVKERSVLLVQIKQLSEGEKSLLSEACGGDFSAIPELKKGKIPNPHYPFEMRRRGETATVTCLVLFSANGKALKIYRLGNDSDLFFTECARVLVDAKAPKGAESRYYRIVLKATLRPD